MSRTHLLQQIPLTVNVQGLAVLPWETPFSPAGATADFSWTAQQKLVASIIEAIEALAHVATIPAAFRTSSTNLSPSSSTVTTIALDATGILDGDLVLIALDFGASPGTITPPDGFTLAASGGNARLYAKIADDEPDALTFSWVTPRKVVAVAGAYSGASGIDDFAVTVEVGTSVSHVVGPVTAEAANDIYAIFACDALNILHDPVSGWTEREDFGSVGAGLRVQLQDLIATNDAGAKGPYTFNGSSGLASQVTSFLVAITTVPSPVARLPFEALDGGALTQTALLTWEALLGLAASDSLPMETRPAIQALAALVYEASGQASTSESFPWEDLDGSAVFETSLLVWEALLARAATNSLPWETPPSLRALVTTLWEARGILRATASSPWTARQKLAKTAQTFWENLRGHPVPRSQTVTHRWESLIGRKQTTAERWEARGWLFATRSLPWTARAILVASQAPLAYEALVKLVRRPDDTPWEALKMLKRDDANFPWEATGTPPPRIIGTALLAWESLAALERVVAAPWESVDALRATASLPWEIPPGVLASAQAAYEALVGVQAEPGAPIEWEGRIAVGNAAQIVWETLEAVVADLEIPWESESTAGGILANAVLFLDSVAARSQAETGAWEARGGVSRATSLPWETEFAAVAELLAFFWEAASVIQETSEYPLEVEGRSSRTARLPWEAILLQFPGVVVSTIIAGAIAEGGTIAAGVAEGESAPDTAVEANTVARFIALAAILAAFASTISDQEAGTS